MIEPRIDALLEGLAASLETAILPALADAPLARRQAREAVRTLRRLGASVLRLGPSIAADNADMEETLRALGGSVPTGGPGTSADLAALSERHRALQHALLLLDDEVHQWPEPRRGQALAELRALYRRMLARERMLSQPAPSSGVPE